MSIPKTYNPLLTEDKWYSHWIEKNYFNSKPDNRDVYTIVIPPPNVTGVLHMGHMLNNTLQDVMIRRARMMGYNGLLGSWNRSCIYCYRSWVVQKLSSEGIKKSDLTREEFLSHAF